MRFGCPAPVPRRRPASSHPAHQAPGAKASLAPLWALSSDLGHHCFERAGRREARGDPFRRATRLRDRRPPGHRSASMQLCPLATLGSSAIAPSLPKFASATRAISASMSRGCDLAHRSRGSPARRSCSRETGAAARVYPGAAGGRRSRVVSTTHDRRLEDHVRRRGLLEEVAAHELRRRSSRRRRCRLRLLGSGSASSGMSFAIASSVLWPGR